MALFNCPECKKEISADADVCPHCGKKKPRYYQHPMFRAFQAIAVVAGILVFLHSLGVFGGDDKKDKRPLDDPPRNVDTSRDKNIVVVIETSKGTIKAELFAEKAPNSVANFVRYADDKFYDGTIFHRVIPGFMIQGGGMLPGMVQKTTRDPIKNESYNGLKNDRGTLAMARTQALDSATSQFYINVVDNPALDQGKYAVFGKSSRVWMSSIPYAM
jgi:cyclophilin family peptidyl-prolyl cis-trans isomerase